MKSHRALLSCFFSILFVVVLAACGGGSSSSDGGGDSNFDITPYVGEWLVSINAVVSFRGQTGVSIQTFLAIIDPQGRYINPDADPQCPSGLDGQIINSNPFSWSSEYICTGDGIGQCRVIEFGTLRLSGGDTATGEITQNSTCGANDELLRIDSTFTAAKQS